MRRGRTLAGGASTTLSTVGSHTTLLLTNIVEAAPHVRAGKLRGLGVTTLNRAEVIPSIPTIAESGYPGTDPVSLGRTPIVKIEERVPQAAREALAKLGHEVQVVGPWGGGGATQLIELDHGKGVLRGATDPRPGGLALGF